MPQSGNYLGGRNATVTINGTQVLAIKDGSFKVDANVDETTNSKSGGYYEDIDTIKKATLTMEAVYDGDDPPVFVEGDVVSLEIAIPSGPGISGDFRIASLNFKSVNVKGAVTYSIDANSQGAYVRA